MADLKASTGIVLSPWREAYSFEQLADAPDYSIAGSTFLDAPFTTTFAGEPWEVFEANGLIYDFVLQQMRPIESVTQSVSILASGNELFANGLILPGALTPEGQKVKSYSGWYSRSTLRWTYSEVDYV